MRGENIIKNIKFIDSPLFKNIIPICLYENSKLSKYKNPPRIILDMYKYNRFINVYFIVLYPNVIKIIKILIIIIMISNNNSNIFI